MTGLFADAPWLRSRREQAQVRLDAVLSLHVREMAEALPWACINGDCEHEDECPTVDLAVCGHCNGLVTQDDPEALMIAWPCPTATAAGVPTPRGAS